MTLLLVFHQRTRKLCVRLAIAALAMHCVKGNGQCFTNYLCAPTVQMCTCVATNGYVICTDGFYMTNPYNGFCVGGQAAGWTGCVLTNTVIGISFSCTQTDNYQQIGICIAAIIAVIGVIGTGCVLACTFPPTWQECLVCLAALTGGTGGAVWACDNCSLITCTLGNVGTPLIAPTWVMVGSPCPASGQ